MCGKVWLHTVVVKRPPGAATGEPSPVPLPPGAWGPRAQALTLEAPTGLLRPEAGDGNPTVTELNTLLDEEKAHSQT